MTTEHREIIEARGWTIYQTCRDAAAIHQMLSVLSRDLQEVQA